MRGYPAGNQAQFKIRHEDSIPIIEIIGDVDLNNADAFAAALASAARTDRRGIVVVLDGVSYFDTQGIHVLFRASERLATQRQCLHVVIAKEHHLRRILQVVGLLAVIPVFSSVDEAIINIHPPRIQQGTELDPTPAGVPRVDDEA